MKINRSSFIKSKYRILNTKVSADDILFITISSVLLVFLVLLM